MARRSTVSKLPQEVRDALNARLIENGFSDYEILADWLSEQGFEISRSAVHRHGQSLQAEFEEAMADVRRTTALARAYAQTDDDVRGDLMDSTARIVQEQLLKISLALRKAEDDPGESAKLLSTVTRALADIGRMNISLKKYQSEVRMEATQEAADKAAKVAKAKGLSKETVDELRREILGVA